MMPGMRFPARANPFLHGRARLLAAIVATAFVVACGTPHPAPPTPRRVEPPADVGLPASAARALAERFPWLHAIGHAAGRLQVDDADDLAVVLAPLGQSHDAVVALLVTGAGDAYRVATVSKPVAPGCEPCTISVDIARHLLSVHVIRPSDPDFERVTYQFGYREADDAPRLVGVSAAQPAGDDPIAHSYAISTNLLDGAKLDTLDPTSTDPARRRELRSRVPPRPAIAFDAFPFTSQALAAELRRLPAAAFEPQEPLPAAAATLLRTRFPGASVRARSAGELRAPGVRDLAVVLAPPPGADADADATLALLLARPDGSLRLGAVGGSLTRACRGCDVQVQIAHRALVVQTTASDAAGTRVVGYQFMAAPRSKTGALRLVGVRTVLSRRTDGGDSHRDVSTANLLTGDKLDVSEDVVRGRRQRVERASRIALRPTILLAGFAFDPGLLDAETRHGVPP
jgi:hypothetical protein